MNNNDMPVTAKNTANTVGMGLKETNLYYFTQSALFVTIAIFLSLLIYNYLFLNTTILRGNLEMLLYNRYNISPFFGRNIQLNWIYAAFKCLLITGSGIWGIIALTIQKRSVKIPLFALAGLLLIDILSPAYYFGRNAMIIVNMAGMAGLKQTNLLGQFKGYMFYMTISFTLLILVLCCIIAIMRFYQDKLKAPVPPGKSISGIGGWMILCMIRNIVISLNFLYTTTLVVGRYGGVRSLFSGPESHLEMELGLLILFAAVLAIVVVIRMFKKEFAFKPLAISLEGTAIMINFFSIVSVLTRLDRQYLERLDYFPGGLITAILLIGVSVLFIIYYSKSDRVKNTYQKNLFSYRSDQ